VKDFLRLVSPELLTSLYVKIPATRLKWVTQLVNFIHHLPDSERRSSDPEQIYSANTWDKLSCSITVHPTPTTLKP
jgi:hypothetical protein